MCPVRSQNCHGTVTTICLSFTPFLNEDVSGGHLAPSHHFLLSILRSNNLSFLIPRSLDQPEHYSKNCIQGALSTSRSLLIMICHNLPSGTNDSHPCHMQNTLTLSQDPQIFNQLQHQGTRSRSHHCLKIHPASSQYLIPKPFHPIGASHGCTTFLTKMCFGFLGLLSQITTNW